MNTNTASAAVRITSDAPRVGPAPAAAQSVGTLTDYIEAAMQEAQFELMENGDYFGSIPSCQGVWADAPTVEECRTELRSVLEDWMLVGFRHSQEMPVIAGINLNVSLAPIDAEAD
jgi:predicted RNase H-like HicB family nuclease